MKEFTNIISRHPKSRDHLIPILQEIQVSAGYLPREGIDQVAAYLELPKSKIFGVATFYNQFKLNPPGRNQILVCRGTACHVRGSLSLLDVLTGELGIEPGETTKDGEFSLDVVACLGACSIAPVITINGEFFGRLDKKKLVKLLDEVRSQGAVNV